MDTLTPNALETIFFHPKDEELAAEALAKIDRLEAQWTSGLSKSKARPYAAKAEAMRALATTSSLSYAYCAWLLADDPDEFRRNLPHNLQFREEAQQYGINLDVYFEGIEDAGITIDISELKNTDPMLLENETSNLTKQLLEMVDEYDDLESRLLERTGVVLEEQERELREYHFRNAEDARRLVKMSENVEGYSHFKSELSRMYEKVLGAIKADLPLTRNLDQLADYDDTIHEMPFNRRLKILLAAAGTAKELITHNARKLVDFIEHPSTSGGSAAAYPHRRTKKDFKNPSEEDPLGARTPPGIADEFSPSLAQVIEEAETLHHLIENLYNDNEDNQVVFAATIEEGADVEKMARHGSVTYIAKREKARPEDATIGNEGGACIGVYNGEITSTNDGLPFLLLDEGTLFIGIYQKLKDTEARRVGFVLAFASADAKTRACLAANSTELSRLRNPVHLQVINPLVDYIHQHLVDFAEETEMRGAAMGSHKYNTSINYGSPDERTPFGRKEGLIKLPLRGHPLFYQEIFTEEEGAYEGIPSRLTWLKKPRDK